MGAPQYEQAGADIGGTGTTNTIPRWTGPSTLGDSGLIDNGTAIYTTTRSVGIGTNAPGNILLRVANGAVGDWTSWLSSNSTASQSFGLRINAGTNANDVALRVMSSGSAEYLYVRGDGNVGIGTASPDARLQVIGASGNAALRIGYNNISQNYYDAGDHFFRSSGGSLTRWQINTSGHFIAGADNTYDIGASGATRPRTVYVGTSIGIGANPTASRALTTVADLDVFGVTVGRGANGVSGNTAVGAAALGSVTSASATVGVGFEALNALSTGAGNTAVGYRAVRAVTTSNSNTGIGYLAVANMTGASNTGLGQQALQGAVGASGGSNVGIGLQAGLALTTGANNVLVGSTAGDSVTTGSSNIVIGSGADLAAATDSNKLVIGDATNYVATNGGATTYYATAGALAGYIVVRLNGTDVKLPVYAL